MVSQIVYLQPNRFVALLDPKLLFRLKSELDEDVLQCRPPRAALIDLILAEIDLSALEFANFYDRRIRATYLLLDRAQSPTGPARNQSAEFSLLYVLGEIDAIPSPTKPETRPVQMGFWEKLVK